MKILKEKILILLLLCMFCGCVEACNEEEKCGPTTTCRGFVFMYDTNNNISYTVERGNIRKECI